MEGFSLPDKRTDQIILEANLAYWDTTRFPQLQRIIFDNTLAQHDAVELVKTAEGRVDLVSELSPLETLRVAQSPFAKVVKNRGALGMVFGQFNMRKKGGPWRDARLRQAANMAINRDDLIQYAAKGNGVIAPAMLAVHAFGYDPDLAPYAFDPLKARALLRAAGYSDGLAVTLIAPPHLEVPATVVSKMLEQVGFTVERQMLEPAVYNLMTRLPQPDHPTEQQVWDIALTSWNDSANFAVLRPYFEFALGGVYDWVLEEPELQQLYAQVSRTVDREQQQALIRQMERHTRDQAYFLFLYNPIKLYAVNKAVEFVPYVSTTLNLAETAVTEQHWSVRK
ncbi:MAG: ABC transporter substrate-binding protein [Candidatus Tectomicrobia bacterium]|uniref:ABC transporter substrate-binding protein n=1 Tax=Tectimicrobiota bacterium TaxID=2528274 RepID=A0A937W1L2_UNCTE|nr:ABC transporter substrate-binding protein [Candidatus Tectomicrobia bacterium]